MLKAALHYISDNIPVFPVGRSDKHPLCEHGLKDATIDEAQIRAWWQIWPNAMIGIAAGPRSGVWVLDIDVDAKKAINGHASMAGLEIEHGALPLTLCSITPRGGQHYLFRWNGANVRSSVGKIAPGIDVRGDGGYFVAPPSARADGVTYHWKDATAVVAEAPAWLIELALAASSNGAARRIAFDFALDLNNPDGTPRKLSSVRDYVWARAALQRECGTLNNNAALNVAAFNLGQIVSGGGLTEQEVIAALLAGAEDCGLIAEYGQPSVIHTINSGLRAGMKCPRQRPR
jgi:putative DNA primase/helicase